jgi:pyruvate,water dikinase
MTTTETLGSALDLTPAATGGVRWFSELRVGDVALAGGKGANLGELTAAGLPVPEGFVVSAPAFLQAMGDASVRDQLRERAGDVDADAPAALAAACELMQRLVHGAGVPDGLRDQVVSAYLRMGHDVPVAVRSSATAEDSAGTSFAGMNETYTNVVGVDALLARLVDCWASLYAPRVTAYRASKAITDEPAIAVVVQRMVDSELSGVMFTADPASGDLGRIVIEGAFGLGEVVVAGQVEPDTYVVAKDGLRILSARIGHKDFKLVRGLDGADQRIDLTSAAAAARVLTDDQVVELAKTGLAITAHYRSEQDVEWAFERGQLFIVQSRPITTLLSGDNLPAPPAQGPPDEVALVSGLAAAPGVATGRVRILTSPQEGSELLAGEVLVAPMTNPDWVPTIRRASALVTDQGGMTCHASIVARELGVPCIVGTRTATTVLRNGELVTVDGTRGQVLAGDVRGMRTPTPSAPTQVAAQEAIGTKLYVNLAMPSSAEAAAALPVDGVGLLRAELMLTEALNGMHPRELIARGEQRSFVDQMSASLLTITRAFGERPVVYRSIDFRTNEFRGLTGGAAHEPVEDNPMIGYRGCFRYVREPDLFGLELEALARVREQTPNLHLMIPFVRTAWELEAVLDLVDASPLGAQRGLLRWVMAEVPSVAYRIPTGCPSVPTTSPS